MVAYLYCDGCGDPIRDQGYWYLMERSDGVYAVTGEVRDSGPFHFHSFDCLVEQGKESAEKADALHEARAQGKIARMKELGTGDTVDMRRKWHIRPKRYVPK